MKETIIANRYAKALFEFALEQDILEKIRQDMDLLISVCKSNKDFRLLLKSPVVKFDKKVAIIIQIFGKKINNESLRYLQLIIRKRREAYIQSIAEHFIALYKDFKGIKIARLLTADNIDDGMRHRILQLLKKYTNAQIELIEEIDPLILGGFVLEVEGRQYDASLLTGIKKLKREFESNIYIKGF
jgi:F-type H+-transporting ATPase subunit delta